MFANSSRELQGLIYRLNSEDLSSDKEKGARKKKVVAIIVQAIILTSKDQAEYALGWPKYSYWINHDRGTSLHQKRTLASLLSPFKQYRIVLSTKTLSHKMKDSTHCLKIDLFN